jgi:ABC-type dipeptide/oligopeptide/nickel transport system permease component
LVISLIVFCVIKLAVPRATYFNAIAYILQGYLTQPVRANELIWALVPQSLELIVIPFIIASGVGLLLNLISAPVPRAIVSALVMFAGGFPFFWIAVAMEMLVATHGPAWLSSRGFTVTTVALVIFSLPSVMETLEKRSSSIARDCVLLFSERLPEIIGATLILETLLALHGEGRAFFEALEGVPGSRVGFITLIGFLLVSALTVLLIRTFAHAILASVNGDGAEHV